LTTAEHEIVVNIVGSYFSIRDYYIREDGLEFKINPTVNTKQNFILVNKQLKSRGIIPILRKRDDELVIRTIKEGPSKQYSLKIPIILFIIVICTITADGWLRISEFIRISDAQINFSLSILYYVIGIIGIIGFHELGHFFMTRIRGNRSSLPFFIPGLPGVLPTFGALITSKEPPLNKDALFDLGISGPICGLIVTLIVSIPAAMTSTLIPISEIAEEQLMTINPNVLMNIIFDFFGKSQEGSILLLSPLGFAVWLGFLITFLNLLPAWQLDGGHMANAMLGKRVHMIATWLSIFLLFVLGFFLMAMLIIFFSRGYQSSGGVQLLDDVSPLSYYRKIAYLGIIGLIVLLAPLGSFLF
jgi:Zn-dependent protease